VVLSMYFISFSFISVVYSSFFCLFWNTIFMRTQGVANFLAAGFAGVNSWMHHLCISSFFIL
jgi:hypothetical protein